MDKQIIIKCENSFEETIDAHVRLLWLTKSTYINIAANVIYIFIFYLIFSLIFKSDTTKIYTSLAFSSSILILYLFYAYGPGYRIKIRKHILNSLNGNPFPNSIEYIFDETGVAIKSTLQEHKINWSLISEIKPYKKMIEFYGPGVLFQIEKDDIPSVDEIKKLWKDALEKQPVDPKANAELHKQLNKGQKYFILLLLITASLYPLVWFKNNYYWNFQKKASGNLDENGNMHGRWVAWYKDGQKSIESGYKNGKKHGKWISWYKNGHKQLESEFKDDKPHGTFIKWHENGQKEVETEYKDGILHGKTNKYYESGKIEIESEYENGLKHGKWIEWFENGKKRSEGKYTNDLKSGKWTWWHNNGIKSIEGIYKDGIQCEKWTWWDENGKITDINEITKDKQLD